MTPIPRAGEEALLLAIIVYVSAFGDENWDEVAEQFGRNDPETLRHIYYEGITANPGGPTAQTTSALALRTHFPALPQRLPPILGFPAGTTTAQSAVVPAPTRRIRRKKRTAQDADLDVKEEEEDEKAGCCKAPVTKKRKRDDRKDDDDGAGGAAGAGIAC